MAETAGKTTTPRTRKSAGTPDITVPAATANAAAPLAAAAEDVPALTSTRRAEAKSRFTAALDEARAGAALLGEEARERVGDYSTQARSSGENWVGDAKAKAGELAVEGKARASEAISGLARLVNDNAGTIDEKLGAKYGDYARSASKSIGDVATRLEQKSVEELGEDAREFVRKSPATAVGLAALAGFLIARIFRGK